MPNVVILGSMGGWERRTDFTLRVSMPLFVATIGQTLTVVGLD
jgi:hypothetical protein